MCSTVTNFYDICSVHTVHSGMYCTKWSSQYSEVICKTKRQHLLKTISRVKLFSYIQLCPHNFVRFCVKGHSSLLGFKSSGTGLVCMLELHCSHCESPTVYAIC